MGRRSDSDATVLRRLARWCYRHRWVVVATWFVALAGIQGLSGAVGGKFVSNLTLPGAESQRAVDLLETRFPAQAGDTVTVVFKADQGVADPAVREQMESLFARVASLDHVLGVASPYAPEAQGVSPDGRIAFATVQLDVGSLELPQTVSERMLEMTRSANRPGLLVELGGRPIREAEEAASLGGSEAVGLVVAAIILLVAFGSLVAAGLPLITALFALGVGLGLVSLLTRLIDIADITTELALMIGLGVGIDYALLIVTRFRQELHAGVDTEEAVATAFGTAGRAVLFAGLTVVISLTGVLLMGLDFIRGVALGAMTAVLLTVLAALTLLPAMLGFAGRAVDRFRVPGLHRNEASHRASVWFRWSRLVQRHPVLAAGGALAIVVLLTVPAFSMRLGTVDEGSDSKSLTTRRAYDLLSQGFGPGFNGPLLLVAELPDSASRTALDRLGEELRRDPEVALVLPPVLNASADTAVLTVVPTTAPQDSATERLIDRLRDRVIPGAVAGTGASIHVGGVTAVFTDMGEIVTQRLPLVLGAVIGLSFLLLMAVFRSLLLPLAASVLNVLAVGAAYGTLVVVFQWGWLKDLVGVDRTGPIESFLPAFLFAVLFGLSMDYEVFMLSRVREEYVRSRDNSRAVADGLATTARVISAAAAIMITVFLSFVLTDNRIIKMAGLGLASAILIQAAVIQLALFPAVMELLGESNWRLPRWLDRILPGTGVEGRRAVAGVPVDDEPPAELGTPETASAE